MSEVFSDEQSVFFVGGRGDGSGGISDAGGCTKVWWDAEVAANGEAAALAKLMSSTGAPIINMGTADYTTSDERITRPAAFGGVEVGMVVYIIKDGGVGIVITGRYKITDVDPGDNWVECLGIQGTDCTVTIVIGGAFEELSTALDETSASIHSVQIYTNLSEILGTTLDFLVGGAVANNTFKRVSGYNTVPGDMDRGGAYYETPFEILQNGAIDSSKCVTLDANGGAFDVLTFGASIDNCVMENIHFTGTTASKRGIEFADANAIGVLLRNCRISDLYQGVNATVVGLSFVSCYTHSDVTSHAYVIKGQGGLLLGCVSKLPAMTIFANIVGVHATVIGCLTVGGRYGIQSINAGSGAVVIGNTFYNLTDYGVRAVTTNGVVVLNNIFSLAPGAVGLYTTSGSIIENDYNCFIETDGTPLTIGETGSGDEVPALGKHSIELDPQFVDVATNNFRLQSSSPCRRTGRPTVGAT